MLLPRLFAPIYNPHNHSKSHAPSTDDITPRHGFASGLFGRRTRSFGSGGRGRCVADCTALLCGFGTIVDNSAMFKPMRYRMRRDSRGRMAMFVHVQVDAVQKVRAAETARMGLACSAVHVCCGCRCLPTGRHAQPTTRHRTTTFFPR